MFLKTKSATTALAVRPLSFSRQTSASRTLASVTSRAVGDSIQLGVRTSGYLPDRGGRDLSWFSTINHSRRHPLMLSLSGISRYSIFLPRRISRLTPPTVGADPQPSQVDSGTDTSINQSGEELRCRPRTDEQK
jgi:hypothetical protein